MSLDGEAYTVVGVMPASFSIASWGITARDLWVPLGATRTSRAPVRDNHNEQVGRPPEAGRRPRAGERRDGAISSGSSASIPQANAGWGATVIPLQELIVGDIRMSLVMLVARSRAGPADRVRQRRQPALRARARPPQGDRDPLGARRGARASLSAAADRSAGAGDRRRRRRVAHRPREPYRRGQAPRRIRSREPTRSRSTAACCCSSSPHRSSLRCWPGRCRQSVPAAPI